MVAGSKWIFNPVAKPSSIDRPHLSDSLTKKYAGTNKPHVRMTERVIAPERLDFLDVVTSSHNHTDHLDGVTLVPLWKANPNLTVLVPRANVHFAAQRLQVPAEKFTPSAGR
jgi:L-ascorbate metabolism protein UlaG (beta-lactamase superfamily)